MEIKPIIACTHSGVFHSDEVLACALLRLAAAPNRVSVIRSRQPQDWQRADYVIDVGGAYDGVTYFDHHMVEGAGKHLNGVPYSAFGLLWKTLGTTTVTNILSKAKCAEVTPADIQEVVRSMESFVSGIDAHDQALLATSAKFSQDKHVSLDVVSLQQVISSFNPIPLLEEFDDYEADNQFYEVLDWTTEFLSRFISRKASRVLAEAYVQRWDNGEAILVLPSYCDWNSPVSDRPHIMFVVYPSLNGKSYTVQAAKKGGGQGSLNNLRMPFPQAWAGLNDGELQQASGVADAVFCHRDRFIAAATSRQGAITMAQTTIRGQA